MTQRQPRIEDPTYLAYVRTLPCVVCNKAGPSDAAHLRSASLWYGKRQTGLGEKPDDKWTLPLCRYHHTEQHSGNELSWWARIGVGDPFAIAVTLYESRPVRRERTKRSKPRRTARRAIPGKPMQSANRLPKRGEVKFNRSTK
jgi:hypothetical protein